MSEAQVSGETFAARAFGHAGNLLGEWIASSVRGAMDAADRSGVAGSITVRGERTSDGTTWPDHGGRVVATRDGRRWQVG